MGKARGWGMGQAGAAAKESHEDLRPQEYGPCHCSMPGFHAGHTHSRVRIPLLPHCSHDVIVALAGEVKKDYMGSVMVTFLQTETHTSSGQSLAMPKLPLQQRGQSSSLC